MKNLLFSLLLLLMVGSTATFASNEHTFSICNINRTGVSTVQFDVWMKNVSSNPTDTIYVQSPTFNINWNTAIRNGGKISATQVTVSGQTKYLPAKCRTSAPDTATIGIVRMNGVVGSQKTDVDGNLLWTMWSYTLVPGDSVLCGRYQLKTSAAKFAVAPLNLEFRPFKGASPVTSCNYFPRFDEGSTGPNCIDDGSGGPKAVPIVTLSTAANETYNNIDAVGNTALPVELSSFAANTGSGRDVSLTWTTATEVNFSKFVVERTVKGAGSWSQVTTVNAAGNSNSEKPYSYTDKKLNTGSYEYRLKMVDNDGTFTYSNSTVEATVAKPKNFEMSQNYPNPFNPTTRVDYQLAEDAHVVVEIYNITGQKVAQVLNEQQAAGYYTMQVNSNITSSLASGIYLYRIATVGNTSDSKFTSIKKMILMK
jgi:hypothetical protein